MQGVRRLDPAPAGLQQALGQHRLGAARALLAGLEHQDHVTGQLGPQLGQDPGGSDERGDVQVMATGVHPARVL